ncbi:MAG: GTP 3',8-cyclase MoaA, partial [Acetivibrio sp.]
NCLLMKDWNQEEAANLVALAKIYPLSVRFIEMMPIGNGTGFRPVYQEEILAELEKTYGKMTPCQDKIGNGPALYYKLEGFQGRVGFISAVSHEFCKGCNRIRLTSDGNLKLCLQYKNVLNIKELLNRGIQEEQVTEIIRMAIFLKPQKHDFSGICKNGHEEKETKSMAQIGG